MSKFTNDIHQLIEYIGGKANIVNVSHCATGLRFVLEDPKKADIDKIEGIESVKGSFTQAGQFQVIIGNEVSTFYNELIQIADIEEATPATISAYLGVTEPAMFGINLKYSYPFLGAMIGSALASIFSVGTGVMANSIGVGGLPGILSIQPQHMGKFAIAMLIAIIVPFALTIILSKNKKWRSKELAKIKG